MKRKASAVWVGGLKDGRGTITAESGVLTGVNYSFAKRFGDEAGTNPEELIGAAHASCFSMAFSAQLGEARITPTKIESTSTVTVEKVPEGFAVTAVHLDVVATVSGASEEAVLKAAEQAKEGCPISKLLKAPITMNAKFQQG